MRSIRSATQLLAAIAFAASAGPLAAQQPARDGTVARLVDMNGNVLVSREAGLASGNEKLRLPAGTRVITTAKSEVVVEYDTGCRVRLKENQRFEVEVGKPCAMLLAQDLFVAPAAVGGTAAVAVVPAVLGVGGLAMIIDGRRKAPVSPN